MCDVAELIMRGRHWYCVVLVLEVCLVLVVG